MFFLMGVTQREEAVDHDQTIICDVCGSFGRLNVFVTYMVLTLFFIPVFKWNRRYYVEMSCCRTLYELDPEIGKAIERGQIDQIEMSDLTMISQRSVSEHKKCPYCGYETDEDFDYCPKCGNKL